ncbi:MAG: hypothetical protein WD225_13130 [Ilumatobacteraceae bacterium]
MLGATMVAATTVTAATHTPASLEAVASDRAFDSRDPDGSTGGAKVQGDSGFGVEIAGDHGVPDDAAAVIVNVAAVEADEPGFVSLLPGTTASLDGTPTTSNLNVEAGQTIANTAVVPLGQSGVADGFPGAIVVYTSTPTHLVVDVLGYVPAGAAFESVDFDRALDTRTSGEKALPDQRFDIDVATGGPADAEFVLVNLTMIDADGPGFVTAFPGGASQPPTSNLNVDAAGQTRAAFAILPIGDDGEISVVSDVGAHLLVDVLGYFGAGSGFATLPEFDRVFDSRPDAVAAGSTTNVNVATLSDVPETATYVLVNVTAVEAAEPGFLTVWPNGIDQPGASNLNYGAGGTVANTVLVPLGADGAIDIYSQSETGLLVDVVGWV